MTNFLQNIEPEMVAKMSPENADGIEPLNSTENKIHETVQTVLEQTDTSKCWKCTRKVGLLGFKCKCKYIFCSKHRHADEHACTYDYLTANKEKLKQELKQCVGTSLHDKA